MSPTLAGLAARLRARGRGEVLELPVSRLGELDSDRGRAAAALAERLQVTRVGALLDALAADPQLVAGRAARQLARELWAWATALPLRTTVTWEPGAAVDALAVPAAPYAALLDAPAAGLADGGLAQFVPDMTLAALWRPGAPPRLVRPEFFAYLVHQAKEEAAALLRDEACRRAIARARARAWAEPPSQAGPRRLAASLRASLRAASPEGSSPPLVKEGIVWVDRRAATLHYACDDSGERVRLELADFEAGAVRVLSKESGDEEADGGLGRAALAWALDGLHTPGHPLHAALTAIGHSSAWEEALRALAALGAGRPEVAVAAAEEEEEGEQRLVWRVDVRDHRVQVQPALQKRTRGDRWSRGQGRSAGALAEDPDVALTPADHAVHDALLLLEARTRRGALRPEDARHELAALRALAEHPRAVAACEPRIALRVREVAPTLRVDDEPEGMTLRLQVGSATVDLEQLERGGHPGCVAALDLDAAVCWFCPRTPLLDELCALLLDTRAPIPEAGHAALLAALEPLQPAVRLELAARLLGAEEPACAGIEVGIAEVPGDNDGDAPALALTLRAQPLPAGLAPIAATTWAPGEGPPLRFGSRAGARGHVVRDLEGERRRAAQLAARLGLSASDGAADTFRVDALERALDLLQALDALAVDDPTLRVRWAEGQAPWRVSKRASAADVRVRVERSGAWLGVDGEVDLGGASAPLAAVLEATRAGRRYLALGERRYAEITPELRRRLSRSDEALFNHRGELAIGDTMVEAVTDLVDDRSRLAVDPAARRLLARLEAARSLSTRIPAAFEGVLRDYQIAGFHWMMQLAAWSAGACLADEMGLGKTIQALAVLSARGALGPSLVVAPTSLCRGWLAECERFAPQLRPILYHGPGRSPLLAGGLMSGDLLITSYDVVVRDAEALAAIPFASVVLDEAQAVKNARTRRARAIHGLRADWRVALTGTPIENHLGELWGLMHTVSPGLLGTWDHFRERYAAPIERDHASPARDKLRRLLDPYVLRRTKAQVAPELPPRTEVVDAIELSAEERALYESTRAAALRAFEASEVGELGRFAVLAAITRLRQLACHPRLVDPQATAPSAKLRRLLTLVDDLRRDGHRALLFSQFTSHLALVREALEAAGVELLAFDGATPAARRAALVERWQAGEGAVFLISLQAGGAGLNLTAADYVVHLDPWWNPAVEDQASDRAHRIGQTRPVTVVRLVTQGTIEEAVLELHAAKRSLAASLLSGDGSVPALSPDDLLGLLRGDGSAA
ncbi:MAG: DEAD/DEAH box helicase [Nannocystaceae bacterium]